MATVKGPVASYYVFFGEEDYFLDKAIDFVQRWPDREVVRLDASEGLSEEELVDILETQTIDDVKRTIVVDYANKLKESKAKVLRHYVDTRASGQGEVLVAIVRSGKLSDLWSGIGAKGKLAEHKKFKPWPDKTGKNDYERWIETEAKRFGLGLESGVPELIYQMTGESLYRISNELRKLLLLVGNGNKVSKQHVISVIAVTPNALPKDVVEAAFAKNPKQAMNSLSLLFRSEGDSASVPLVYSMMRETQKYLTARYLLDKGASQDEIATAVGMHPYRCKISLLPHLKKHDQRSLISLMQRLCKLDRDVKSSSISKRTLVELTVLSIAA